MAGHAGKVTPTTKMRLFALPSIVRFLAPGPLMDTGPEIGIAPDVSTIVPVSPAAKLTMSGPGDAFAWAMALRRLPPPLLFRLLTTKTCGPAPAGDTLKLKLAWGAPL